MAIKRATTCVTVETPSQTVVPLTNSLERTSKDGNKGYLYLTTLGMQKFTDERHWVAIVYMLVLEFYRDFLTLFDFFFLKIKDKILP